MSKENKLDEARKKISEVDSKMAALFEERMEAAAMIADYKKENGLQIYDAQREKELINNNVDLILDENLKDYYIEFLKNTLDVSKQYQRRCIKGARIAYCGNEGAFAQIATKNIFPEGEAVPYKSFQDAYEAGKLGPCNMRAFPCLHPFSVQRSRPCYLQGQDSQVW